MELAGRLSNPSFQRLLMTKTSGPLAEPNTAEALDAASRW